MTLDARSGAFHDLRMAIAALVPHLDPKAAAVLAEVEAMIQFLDRPPAKGLAEYAPDRLRHLLTLAGPEIAPKLLQQLVEDLTQCRSDIVGAVANDDWQAGRNGSHVLMALAGSVGALSLQSLAESLNVAAHRQDGPEAERLLPEILTELTELIRVIKATPPTLVAAIGGDK